MKIIKIEQTTGKDLRRVIAKELVKSPIVAVKELVSNSYDADAERVVVEANEEDHTLLVEDYGSGMNEEDLEGFLRMADSVKIGRPVTPKGRTCIGKFGIAQTLLGYLGGAYDIETSKGNSHIIGTENFARDTGLEYYVEQNTSGQHGTRIFVRGVRTLGTNIFSLTKLERALTWEVPSQEDLPKGDHFQIILNGKKLARKNTKPKQVFKFEAILPHADKVSMRVEYFEARPEVQGVYVYVNNRSVGEPSDFNLAKVSRSFHKKIFARVDADSLKKQISFNRAFFREENPAFSEVRDWVYSCLRQVKANLGLNISQAQIQKPTGEILQEVMRETELFSQGRRGKTLVLNLPSPKKDNYTHSIPRPDRRGLASVALIGLHTVEEGGWGPQARLDTQSRELLVNVSHPWYDSPEITDKELMRVHVLLGTCFALAEEAYLRNDGSKKYAAEFNDLCARLLSQDSQMDTIHSKADSQREEKGFVSSREYSKDEVSERLKVNLTVLRKLVRVGILNPKDQKFSGEELSVYMQKTFGYIPACEVMQQLAVEKGRTRERKRQQVERIDSLLVTFKERLPFLWDIGAKAPFYLVPVECAQLIKGLYLQGAITRGAAQYSPLGQKYNALIEQAAREAGFATHPEFVSLDELCNITRGTPLEVCKIVGYAQRRGVVIPSKFESEQTKYSIAHFKKAREKWIEEGV